MAGGWRCLRCCRCLTHRRDKICAGCRPTKRGYHNTSRPRLRLRQKTRPRALPADKVSHVWKTRQDKIAEKIAKEKNSSLSEHQTAVESEANDLRHVLRDLGSLHSVLANCHRLLLAFDRNGGVFPETSMILTLGLLSYGIAVSAHLTDPDMYKGKLFRAKRVAPKQVMRAECFWCNALANCTGACLGD